jgi:hypothetical protein
LVRPLYNSVILQESSTTRKVRVPGNQKWSPGISSPLIVPRLQQNRRAILERFRNDHGDKRIALMHIQALQIIVNGKTPAAQRNFMKAMRPFLDHCLLMNTISVDPLMASNWRS